METQVRTPQMVFMQPQRLVVPLFQRPYVWNEENQWEPLWNDVVRVADRVNRPLDKHHPHFLGAVVLQQVQKQTGQMLQGWLNYHAVPGNMDSLNAFRSQVLRLWFRALRRRGQRRPKTWARFLTLVGRWGTSSLTARRTLRSRL